MQRNGPKIQYAWTTISTLQEAVAPATTIAGKSHCLADFAEGTEPFNRLLRQGILLHCVYRHSNALNHDSDNHAFPRGESYTWGERHREVFLLVHRCELAEPYLTFHGCLPT